ncbi:diguanylate cyclase (GGDEF)-like protein/PAS domain S-box-containing protein [Desulfitispora alkaliphila]|uniref:histidine kinase N-terminal 7TM domain-containing protein n=1 Tax=Desulfitispora alkaliphila TaxID=622674 RepID=UPI003D20B3D5
MFIYTLLLVAVMYLAMACIVTRFKSVEGSISFAALMLAASIYSVGYFFELRSNDLETAFVWLRIQYFGLAFIPALWITFVVRYCGYSRWLKPPLVVMIWAIPIITLAMINTSHMHSYFYSNISIEQINGLTISFFGKGSMYWLHIGFISFSFMFSSLMLIYTYYNSVEKNKNRFLLLFVGSLVPGITFLLYLFNKTPINIDLSPFALSFTGIIYIYNFFSFKMFNFLSEAHSNVFASIQDAILVVDSNGKIVDINLAAEAYFGNKSELTGLAIDKIFDKFVEQPVSLECGERITEKVYKMKHDERWIATNVSCLIDSEGIPQGKIIIIRDITERKLSEIALQKSEEKFRSIFEHSPLGIYNFDNDGVLIDCNDNFVRIIGSKRQDIIGLRTLELPDKKIVMAIKKTLDGELTQYEDNYTSVTGNKKTPIRALFAPLFCQDKKLIGGVGIIEDNTERVMREKQLEYLSLRDKMTGIYNRAFFEVEIKRLQKSREYPISIISCDVDGLKIINDTMGHERGDRILKNCAKILKQSLRESDILARVGGDEFAIILLKTDHEVGEQIIRRIKHKVEQYNQEAKELPLSISLGVGTAVDNNIPLEEAMKEADQKMYHEKLIQKKSSRSSIIDSLVATLAERDYAVEGHHLRLAEYSTRIGYRLNLPVNKITNLKLLSHVHDLGIIGIPDTILMKGGELTEEEWQVVMQHPEKGYRIAINSPDLAGIADLILKHHERWDGKGYPLGIKGEEIPIECRILAIVDAFDVMTHSRPYNKAKSTEEATEELKRCSGTQFDPKLIEVAVEVLTGAGEKEK